jgi:hypothetical protein
VNVYCTLYNNYMSIFSWLGANKVLALKLFTLTAVTSVAVAGVAITGLQKTDQPEVLGNETVAETLAPSPTPISTESLVSTAKDFIDTSVKTAQDTVGNVLGAAQSTVSKSTDEVKSTVIQSAVGPIIKQVEKLPEKEQEEIKKVMAETMTFSDLLIPHIGISTIWSTSFNVSGNTPEVSFPTRSAIGALYSTVV